MNTVDQDDNDEFDFDKSMIQDISYQEKSDSKLIDASMLNLQSRFQILFFQM